MISRVIISRRARRDIQQGRRWYEKASPGLGDRFFLDVEQTEEKTCNFPLAFAEVESGVRSVLCETFPYVFYGLQPDALVVLAVYHTSRDPAHWNDPNR